MTIKVEASATYPISVEQLWDIYTDHAGWKNWTFMSTTYLDKEGTDHKNGVGAVRVFGNANAKAYEEVTLFEPHSRMEYRVTKGGLPFKNHLGIVQFSNNASSTGNDSSSIYWSCTFDPKIPGTGWLMRRITQYVFDSSLKGLQKFIAKNKA